MGPPSTLLQHEHRVPGVCGRLAPISTTRAPQCGIRTGAEQTRSLRLRCRLCLCWRRWRVAFVVGSLLIGWLALPQEG